MSRLRAHAAARPPVRSRAHVRGLALAAGAAAVSAALFIGWDLTGAVEYILPRRLLKAAAMALVGVAVAVATVAFQTVTANRILTPSIMGLDALYLLVQTSLVFLLGGFEWLTVPETWRFAAEAAVMAAFSLLLFRALLGRGGASAGALHAVLLAGIVCGALFRGVSGLMQRLIDPNDYLILQDLFFASFNQVSQELVGAAAVVVAVAVAFLWRMRRVLDVAALGRETAVGLGVDHGRAVTRVLLAASALVAVSTALVGPVTFFGLLVASLAYQLCPSPRHAWILPTAACLAVAVLLGGQFVLERLLGFQTVLAVVIEFAGGLVFLALLLKGALK
ncbi:iron chelate uptake ABC transporter family permease subunit [Arthrobacter sp. UM1]|uniref:iron chelate uptake ABC transporter family permease subunit n=1 Tax=Arthrobacter sp. UM1 TaxID=2766776 RepID=UPI001CF6FD60|nr:iron chelate uptake ABC transporter family permease subunit [Arthrobacter sp. UM1]MCB4208707.1 iron chelate uptake ABC transporter family permease subunit [Arthrobacter sp. UM1]